MKETGLRRLRVEERLFEEIRCIVPLEMQDPRVLSCTVTRVHLTPDLKLCRVYLDTGTDEEGSHEVLAALERAQSFVRARASEAIGLKYAPRLEFLRDSDPDRDRRIEELFRQIETHHPGEEGERE